MRLPIRPDPFFKKGVRPLRLPIADGYEDVWFDEAVEIDGDEH